MRNRVRDTAGRGDCAGRPRIVTGETRAAVRQMLREIQDRTWLLPLMPCIQAVTIPDPAAANS